LKASKTLWWAARDWSRARFDTLPNVPPNRAIKINASGAGNYRVQYDRDSWKLLLDSLPYLTVDDRVNLVCDSWALAQANRADISVYLDLIGKLPRGHELAERDQIAKHIRLYQSDCSSVIRSAKNFQAYARSILRPSFDELGWEPKNKRIAARRASARELDPGARRFERSRISSAGCSETF